ncbi:MAG: ribosome maturation factor RimM [Anaerolineae bacterium]
MPADSSSPTQPKYLILGEVLRPHGVRGEIRVRLLTDYPERIRALKTVYLAESPDAAQVTSYEVEGIRFHQAYGLLKLKKIDDRNAADLLRQLLVLVDLKHAVPLEEGEFYLYQLIGLRVETESGETLGTIKEVLETGANDVYIVDSPQYGEILIPALEWVVIKTDIPNGIMIIRPPEGLLPG